MHIILNKMAGSGKAEKKFNLIKAYLDENNINYNVSVSEYAGHSTTLAREACAKIVDEGSLKTGDKIKNCIISIGGDGTTREVAEGMIYSDIPLGIIPAGTGNDLARALKIPADPIKAIMLILNGRTKKIDGAKANNKLFFNVAGLGFDVDVLIAERKFRKHIKGSLSYILGLIRALFRLTPHNIKVVSDNSEQNFETNALLAVVGNGRYFGGGIMPLPLADLSDGLLDVCVVSNISRLKVLPVLIKAVRGKHLGLKYTKYFLAKEITITSESEQSVQLDGEIIESTPINFKVLPGSIEVFC